MDTTAHDHEPAPLPDDHDLEIVMAARGVGHELVDGLRQAVMDGWGRSRRRDKADGTPVTEVDLSTDRAIVAGVHEAFPSHAVVSEEGSTHWDGSEWTWVVDPIDGTSNYSAGLPYWATSVALAHHGQVVWGMVDAPALGLRFDAVRGHGTTVNDQPATVAREIDLTDPSSRHSPLAVSAGTIRQVVDGTWFKPRVLGAYALDLALVADGTLVGAFTRVPKVWDVAAGMLLVTEAGGGVVTLGADHHLPLVRDTPLAARSVRTAAGPSARWAAHATTRLWPNG